MIVKKSFFSKEDLLTCARGEMYGVGNPQLPLPPMLMIDQIVHISEEGGEYGKGLIKATFKIDPRSWYFESHFVGDPVMPGCLGLDALWQLVGFFLGWRGGQGRGRALGVDNVKFFKMVTPETQEIAYEISIKRVIDRKLYLGIADGKVIVDDEPIYEAQGLRVGLFKDEE